MTLRFGPPVQVTHGPGVDLRPNWTPRGDRLLFERIMGGVHELFEVEADGSSLTPLTLCNRPGTNASGRAAFFGPEDFAFVSDRGGRPALWRCDLARGEVRPLLQTDHDLHGPALAVGGQEPLLYFRQEGPESAHVGQLGRDTPLTTADGVQDQPWPLPGGVRFVYHAREEGRDLISLQDIAGGATRTLLSPPEGEGTPYVTPFPSPDGMWLAFARREAGVSQVWVMRADGRERQPVTQGPPHLFPTWSPDGRRLAFVQGDPTDGAHPSGTLWTVEVQ